MAELYQLTEEQLAIKTAVRKFAREEVAPRALKLDESHGELDWELIKKACEIGLFSGFLPKKYGGTIRGVTACIVSEEIAIADGGFATFLGISGMGFSPIVIMRDEKLMERLFPPMIEAEKAGKPIFWAAALTEPDAGSDMEDVKGSRTAKMVTTAKRVGNHYIINGRKCFISLGNVAKWISVCASLDKDAGPKAWTSFFVQADTPGLSVGKVENKMGQRAYPTVELIFDDVKVPIENRIGEEGQAWLIMRIALAVTRPTVGAIAAGIAQGAYEQAVNYAAIRYQGGKQIIEHQMIQSMLADMAIQIESSRLLNYHAAGLRPPSMKFSCMAKVFASDMSVKVCTDAMQVLGGYGYMRDYGLEKRWRDARLCQIYEGTNQICRLDLMGDVMEEIGFQSTQ